MERRPVVMRSGRGALPAQVWVTLTPPGDGGKPREALQTPTARSGFLPAPDRAVLDRARPSHRHVRGSRPRRRRATPARFSGAPALVPELDRAEAAEVDPSSIGGTYDSHQHCLAMSAADDSAGRI